MAVRSTTCQPYYEKGSSFFVFNWYIIFIVINFIKKFCIIKNTNDKTTTITVGDGDVKIGSKKYTRGSVIIVDTKNQKIVQE